MTRQKKELVKKIHEIERFITIDMQLGCGCAPAGFYDPLHEEEWMLLERLAHLSHYENAEDMLYDERGFKGQELPFN